VFCLGGTGHDKDITHLGDVSGTGGGVSMITTIRALLYKVKTAIWGDAVERGTVPEETEVAGEPAPVPEPEPVTASVPEIPVAPAPANPDLMPAPEPTNPDQLTTTEPVTVSDEWAVRTYVDPVFVKVGRVYLDAGALVIRSDRDTRGFVIPEDDLDEALTGGIGAVLLFDQTATVGFARLSQSGRAMNIVIDTQLHTVPMRSLTPVLTGQNRKAPLFLPAEDVAPDAGG